MQAWGDGRGMFWEFLGCVFGKVIFFFEFLDLGKEDINYYMIGLWRNYM